MKLLYVFLLVEIILLVYLGISYTMYVYTRHLVSENYPTGEDTSKYKIIVKRYRFWESNTLSTIYLQILLLAFGFFVCYVEGLAYSGGDGFVWFRVCES